MKVKKVEISAFRIYDDPNDATFDLTTKSGNAAGFVALYAPNGFGKTSFYDAVEYGITESIDRFYMRVDELEKLANVQSIDKFIRNTNSERNTYVKIYTESIEEPTYNRQFYKHGNQRHDLVLDSRRRKEHSFQKVILSQEWISAFLTESDGETRYRKFMSNPELSIVDNYYNNLRHLLKALGNMKSDLSKAVRDFEDIIQNVSTENTLERVNNQIQLLKDNFNEKFLEPLSLEATQEQAQRLQDAIAGLLISQNKESNLRQLLEYITIAKSGNDIIIGVNLYYTLCEDRPKKADRLSILVQLLQKFENLDQQQIIIENKRISQANYIAIKNNIEKILRYFEEYLRVYTEMSTKEEERKVKEKDLHDLNSQNEILNRKIIESRSQIDLIIKQTEENATKKGNAPEIAQRLEKLDVEIAKLDDDLARKRTESETIKRDFRNSNESSSQYERILLEIKKGQYPQITSIENSELFDLIQKLQSLDVELSNKRQELKVVEALIAEHQNLNQTIADFIKVGLTIVTERQSSSCPLCEQVYNSYEELVNKITNNKALSDTVKALLGRKASIDTSVTNISDQVNSHRDTLASHYKAQFDQVVAQAKVLESSLSEINIAIENLEGTLSSLRQDREKLIPFLGGISLDEYMALLDRNILDLTNKRNDLNAVLDKDQEVLNGVVAQIDSIQKQITLFSEEVKILIESEQYMLVVNWFKENAAGQTISRGKVIEEDEAYSKRISIIVNEIKDAENIVKDLKKELDSYSRENLNFEKSELQRNNEEVTSRVERYQNYLKDNLKIDVAGLNKSVLSDLLDEEQKKTNSELSVNQRLLDEYQKLNSYCQNIWAFLQSENAKKKAEDAKTELDFLETKVEPQIQREFNSAKEYLEAKVKNFFHVNLINDIYKKIDPHPDFKSVEFIASFEAETPRLDVFVRKSSDESFIVPNLYFSTAQINILSLSIFLASALKETEYKCIFIDDPIQSMDNINVLSTIDLLRSIVINEDRQIILSTHDENFHNLLKKKMPPELFESKFLELESFGKVKAS